MQLSAAPSKTRIGVLKGTAILSLGGVIAGTITALSTSVYARFYSPEQLGYGALFLAMATCLLPLATWRLEYALVNEKDETEIPVLLLLCSLVALTCSLCVGLATFLLGDQLAFMMPTPILMLLPLFVLSLSFFNTATYLFTRHQHYRTMGFNQIALAIVRSVLIIALAYTGTELGVAFGYLLASLLVCMACAAQMHRLGAWHNWLHIKNRDLHHILAKHKNLITHSLSTSFLNNLASNLMPIIFSMHFSARAAGYVFILQQLIAMPAQIVAQALWRTMFAQLAQCQDEAEKSRLVVHIYEVALPLLLMPFLIMMALRNVVTILVGEQWQTITSIVAPFAAMVFFNTLSNVTSYFISFGKYRAESAWNMVILAVRTAAIFILPLYVESMLDCIQYYLLISCVVYFALNAYWASTLGFMKQFLYTNLFLVTPVIGIGVILPMRNSAMVEAAALAACLLLLAMFAIYRYQQKAEMH